MSTARTLSFLDAHAPSADDSTLRHPLAGRRGRGAVGHTVLSGEVCVDVSWTLRPVFGQGPPEFELVAVLLGKDGLARSAADFLYYMRPTSSEGAVVFDQEAHYRHGGADLRVNLDRVEESVARIVFPVNIYEAGSQRENFSVTSECAVRVARAETGTVLARVALTPGSGQERLRVFGELARVPGGWLLRDHPDPPDGSGLFPLLRGWTRDPSWLYDPITG